MDSLERTPISQPQTTTAQKLMVTRAPNEDTPVKMKEFKRAIKDLELKQSDVCDLKSKTLMEVWCY